MIKAIYFKTGIIGLIFCCMSCSIPRGSFGKNIPDAPDYSLPGYWAALPSTKDNADAVPIMEWKDAQGDSPVDVFYVHPTTYTGKLGENDWNAGLTDKKLNERTDQSTIKYQASLFNGAGSIYAPRYRQAHLNCFYTKRTGDASKALELAY